MGAGVDGVLEFPGIGNMADWDWLWWVALAALIWAVGVIVNRSRVRHHDGTGDPSAGIVVFVEPIRWLFVIWGFARFCRGLRRAGQRHRVYLFRWCSIAGALPR